MSPLQMKLKRSTQRKKRKTRTQSCHGGAEGNSLKTEGVDNSISSIDLAIESFWDKVWELKIRLGNLRVINGFITGPFNGLGVSSALRGVKNELYEEVGVQGAWLLAQNSRL